MIEAAKFSINKDDFIHKYFVIVLPSKQRNSRALLQDIPRFLAVIAKMQKPQNFLVVKRLMVVPAQYCL